MPAEAITAGSTSTAASPITVLPFYLLVEGGQNADAGRASGIYVVGIGLSAAERMAFLGFTALPANAPFCDACAATIAVADPVDTENVADAWDEVGIDAVLCSE